MMWRWFERLRARKEFEREEQLVEEVIRENEEAAEEARESAGIPATIISYIPADDDSGPKMDILVEEMTCRMLPEPGSIIWISADEGSRPFKVIRFDYMENGSEYDSMRVYVVVQPAYSSDVMPNPQYLIELNING